jgi:hypothetical protein
MTGDVERWRASGPPRGDAFGDTGLASAADCRKLRWNPSPEEEERLSEGIRRLIARYDEEMRNAHGTQGHRPDR